VLEEANERQREKRIREEEAIEKGIDFNERMKLAELKNVAKRVNSTDSMHEAHEENYEFHNQDFGGRFHPEQYPRSNRAASFRFSNNLPEILQSKSRNSGSIYHEKSFTQHTNDLFELKLSFRELKMQLRVSTKKK
jgi:hypothetical protein